MKSVRTFLQPLTQCPWDFWIIMGWYAVAYLFYRLVLGVPFDTDVMSDMHFLSFESLRNDLALSLLYLHAQPPLMNLLAGTSLKLWPNQYARAIEIVYFISGIGGIAFMFHAMLRLRVGRLSRLAVCLALCTLPTLFLYQTWAYSTHLEFCLCTAALYLLAGFYTASCARKRFLLPLFSVCCLLGLLHAQWHIGLFVGLAALMWIMEGKTGEMRSRIAMACAIGLMPLAIWYAKNAILFGVYGTSSWMGSNLGNVASLMIQPDERIVWPNELKPLQDKLKQMEANGAVSYDFPAAFDMNKIIRRFPPSPSVYPGPAALQPYKARDWPNYNYLGVIDSSRQDMRDALTIIETYPSRYVQYGLENMWNVTWRPSLSYPNLPGLTVILKSRGMDAPAWNSYRVLPQSLRQLLEMGAFLFYFCIPVCTLLMVLTRKPQIVRAVPSWRPFILCSVYLIGTLLVISCFLNGTDQERIRWSVAPAYVCTMAIWVEIMWSRLGHW